MHSIAKIFDIIMYLKNEKNQKLKKKKKKEREKGKWPPKGPKWQKGTNFFSHYPRTHTHTHTRTHTHTFDIQTFFSTFFPKPKMLTKIVSDKY